MVAHNLGLLRAMLRLAVEHEWIPAAPRVRLPKPVERAYVWLENPDDQRRLLIAASETNYPGLMELYATALYTGMRAGELCGLRWSDVDLEHRLITVQRSFATPTKSSKKKAGTDLRSTPAGAARMEGAMRIASQFMLAGGDLFKLQKISDVRASS